MGTKQGAGDTQGIRCLMEVVKLVCAYWGVLPSNPKQTLHTPKGAVRLPDAVSIIGVAMLWMSPSC